MMNKELSLELSLEEFDWIHRYRGESIEKASQSPYHDFSPSQEPPRKLTFVLPEVEDQTVMKNLTTLGLLQKYVRTLPDGRVVRNLRPGESTDGKQTIEGARGGVYVVIEKPSDKHKQYDHLGRKLKKPEDTERSVEEEKPDKDAPPKAVVTDKTRIIVTNDVGGQDTYRMATPESAELFAKKINEGAPVNEAVAAVREDAIIRDREAAKAREAKKLQEQQNSPGAPNPEYEYDTIENRVSALNNRVTGPRKNYSKSHIAKAAQYIPRDHMHNVSAIDYSEYHHGPNGENQKYYTAATYTREGSYITMYQIADWKSLVHEVAHSLHLGPYYEKFPREFNDELRSIYTAAVKSNKGFPSDYSKTNYKEFFAESYVSYVVSRDKMYKRNPKMTEFLDKVFQQYDGYYKREIQPLGELVKKELEIDISDDVIYDPPEAGEFDENLPDAEELKDTNLEQLKKYIRTLPDGRVVRNPRPGEDTTGKQVITGKRGGTYIVVSGGETKEPPKKPAEQPRKPTERKPRNPEVEAVYRRKYLDSIITVDKKYPHDDVNKICDMVAKIIPISHMKTARKIKFKHKPAGRGRGVRLNNITGSYFPMTEHIEIYAIGGYQALTHEIGHAMHLSSKTKMTRETKDKIISLYESCKKKKLGFVSEYAKTNHKEFFAESYAIFMLSPSSLKQRNPMMYSLMQTVMKEFKKPGDFMRKADDMPQEVDGVIYDPEGVGKFDHDLPDIEEDESLLKSFESWLEKYVVTLPDGRVVRNPRPGESLEGKTVIQGKRGGKYIVVSSGTPKNDAPATENTPLAEEPKHPEEPQETPSTNASDYMKAVELPAKMLHQFKQLKAEHFDDKFEWINTAKGYEMSVQVMQKKISEKLQSAVDKADIWVRCPSTRIKDILNDGKFKNISETRKMSPGKATNKLERYLELRVEVENGLFGFNNETPATNRPIYGYLSDLPNGALNNDWLDGYGDAHVKIKKSIRPRTSFTLHDSLDINMRLLYNGNARMIPSPINDIKAESALHNQVSPTRDYSGITSMTHMYAEVQMHNGVTVDDIESIYFTKKPSTQLVKLLDAKGIKYEVGGV